MKRYCLSFLLVFILVEAWSQPAISGPHDGNNSSPAINIAVIGTDDSLGDEYFSDAEKNERKGDLNEALTLFGRAAFEYNTNRKYNKYATSLLRISNVHLMLNHYVEAEHVVMNVALKTFNKIGSKSGQMGSYGQLGKIYLGSNKLTQSLWFFTQQGIIAQQLTNNSAYIESILGIAMVKIKKREYTMALRDLTRAELLAKSLNITQFTGQIKANRNIISEKLGPKKS